MSFYIGSFGILSIVACGASAAYISLYIGLKYYLLKVSYIIQDWPDFQFSRLCAWGDRKHFPISEKISQK